MRLNNIHVSSKEPVNPSLWVDTSGKNPILKGYVNGQHVILSKDVPDNVITKDMIVNSLDSEATDLPLSAAQGKILNEKIENELSEAYYTNMLLSINDSSSNLTDDDINQYIGSWDGLVNAIKNNIPIFDKIKLESSSLNQFSIIPLVAVITDDNSVDLAMFIGVDNSYGQFKIIKVSDNNYSILFAKKVILDTGNNTDLLTDNKTIIGAINEVNEKVSEIPESETYEITLHSSVMTGGKRPEELTSEEIDAAIGGWDNLKAAVLEGKSIKEIVNYSPDDATLQTNVSYEASITTTPSEDIECITLSVSRLENYILGVYDAINIQILNNNGVLTLDYLIKEVFIEGEEYSDLQTTDKTVIGAINENTGNVTRIDRAVGNPVIEEVDLSTPDENSIYWHVNGNKSSQSGYLVKYVTLSKGDLLIANLLSSSSVAQLTVVDSSHTKAIRLVDSVGSNIQIKSSYLAENDCTVALSYRQSTSNMTYIIKSPFNTAVSDNSYMQYLHKVYEEYGAVYNKETGYWELNGLTDLTEEDMWDIYVENMGVSFGSHQNDNYILRLWPFKKARIRFIKTDDPQYYELSAFVFCRNNSKLEVFRCMNELGAETKLKISGRATGLFFGCTNLKDAGVINVSQANIFINKGILAFTKCAKLSRVLLMNLKVDISFQDSPLLSYESLNYLITNAANTAAITVTVHPATYSYLTGTAQPTEEVGGTTEEWQALVTTAQGKQISFAQPAETLEVEPLE